MSNAPVFKFSLLCGTAFGLSLAFTGGALADKITIMVGGVEKQIYLPAKLAEQLGYFKDEGLDIELVSEPAGVDAENELLAGAVQGVVGFYDHTIDLQAKGKFVESIVQFSRAPGEVEMVSSKAADQIKSLPVGAGNTFIAAIQQGKIDAGMTTEPTISRLLKTGDAKVLVDMRSEE